jgi:iron complex outermembrane receptor protein
MHITKYFKLIEMKKISTLLALIIATLSGFAQNPNHRITGTVIDGSQKTIAAATIALARAKDSASIKFSVADKAGKFVFENIPNGRYLVVITAVGHQKGYSETFDLLESTASIELKTLS